MTVGRREPVCLILGDDVPGVAHAERLEQIGAQVLAQWHPHDAGQQDAENAE